MKITKRTKKNIGDMTFKQLMEAFNSDDETSNLEGFDEFEDADDDAEGDEMEDDSDEDTISVTLTTAQVDVLREILSQIDGGSEADDFDMGDETESDDEGTEDDDFDIDMDMDDEAEGEDDDEDEDESFDEDEEVTITDGAPRRKAGTPAYSKKPTVDSVYTRGAKSGYGTPADVSDGAPRRKAGTPATGADRSTVDSRITPGKHVYEI